MSGMGRAALVADLKASLLDASKVFAAPADGDFVRHLDKAAAALAVKRPRTLVHAVTLAAGQANYPVPADLWQYKSTSWGAGYRGNPWDRTWPGRLPQVRVIDGELWLMPAPSSHQIAMLGATFSFFYYALHVVAVDEAETTVIPGDRNLLLLRAQAEAMRELAMRDTVRSASVRDGFSGQMRTNTPAALAELFLAEFERGAV